MVEFVINDSPSQSIGYTPFYLNYGYHPVTPMELLKDADSMTMEGVNQFVTRMEETFKRATKYLTRAQERQKVLSDQWRREQTFQIGE